MKKQAISMGMFLVILISSLACDVSGVVTPTPGMPATPEIATLASIAFNEPVPTATQGAPAATDAMSVTVAAAVAATAATPLTTSAPGKTASPTPTVTPVPNSRSNPVPVGSVVKTDNLQFVVNGITRPADSIVSNGNALNFSNAAGSGKEYLFVNVSITCEKPADQQCILNIYDFKAIGADGVLIKSETTIAGVKDLLHGTSFYGGATVSGNIPFIVTIGDDNVLLVYQTVLGNTFYLALPAD